MEIIFSSPVCYDEDSLPVTVERYTWTMMQTPQYLCNALTSNLINSSFSQNNIWKLLKSVDQHVN